MHIPSPSDIRNSQPSLVFYSSSPTCRISVTFCQQLMRQIAVQNARKYLHKVAKSYAYSPRDIPHSTFAFVPLTFPVKLLTFSVIKMRKLLDSCCTAVLYYEGDNATRQTSSEGAQATTDGRSRNNFDNKIIKLFLMIQRKYLPN